MPTQKPTGARPPQKAASPPKQSQKLPLKANINWLNPDEDGAIRANASLTIGGAFAVHGIKVVHGTKGGFISMPSYKQSDGTYKDIFHSVTAEDRERMNEAVMQAYEQKLAEAQEQTEDAPGEDLDEESPDEEPAEAEKGQGLAR
jgi:stage V sporulation protein G